LARIKYSELDKNMADLVRVLNSFKGVRTIGSCGGHRKPLKPGQWGAGSWYVKFGISRSDYGWFAMEFLAWVVNSDSRRAGANLEFFPTSPPPYLNEPGEMLCFVIEGRKPEKPEKFAEYLKFLKEAAYVTPGQARS
jgi:hypothetical protein